MYVCCVNPVTYRYNICPSHMGKLIPEFLVFTACNNLLSHINHSDQSNHAADTLILPMINNFIEDFIWNLIIHNYMRLWYTTRYGVFWEYICIKFLFFNLCTLYFTPWFFDLQSLASRVPEAPITPSPWEIVVENLVWST